LRAGKRAAPAAQDTPDWWLAVAGCALAGARLINGDVDGAVTDLVRLAGGPGLPLLDKLHRPVFAQGLVAAELSRGNLAEARRWVELMERSVAECRGGDLLPNRTGHIALCHARVALAAGDPEAGVKYAREAVAAFASVDHVLMEAECHQVLGAALAGVGDVDAAIAEFTRSAALYDTCGMPSSRDGVYRQLRALGRNVTAPRSTETPTALPQLTAREAEVAQLVANGLTNKEIMQRLALSRRTVETHISNIRTKLDVGSRAALAATVIRASQSN
jgi:DNA-binding CsgD family transcriptional regulator